MADAATPEDAAGERTSIRVDYHVHTEYSYDSSFPLDAVVAQATRAGIDAVCIADHDTIDGALKLQAEDPPIRVIVGCEFTTDDGSHLVGMHLQEMIEERETFALLDAIHAQGGLALLPHPFRRSSGIFRRESHRSTDFLARVLAEADLVECFNGADTWEKNETNRRLATERAIPSVAGSDAHAASGFGSVYVEYEGDPIVHGRSARAIHFPTQARRAEHPAKRKALELYHRYEDRLPGFVHDAYRRAKHASGRDVRPTAGPIARFQYELPAARTSERSEG